MDDKPKIKAISISDWEHYFQEYKKKIDIPDSYKAQLERLASQKATIAARQAEESKYRRITEPINILICPKILCPECMGSYFLTLMDDGIRIKLRHEEAKCSNSMTEIIRPVAAFIKEI